MGKKEQPQRKFKLTFQLTKNKPNSFELYISVKDTDEITGFIENYANSYQAKYHTPIKCIKSEEIADYPDELKITQGEQLCLENQ